MLEIKVEVVLSGSAICAKGSFFIFHWIADIKGDGHSPRLCEDPYFEKIRIITFSVLGKKLVTKL